MASASRGTVIVILAPTATMSQTILQQSKEEYRLFKPMMPGMLIQNLFWPTQFVILFSPLDIQFFVVTSRGKQELGFLADDPENDIIQVLNPEMEGFMPQLVERLRNGKHNNV